MNDEAFMTYIRAHKPYLFDIEKELIRLNEISGHGQVSLTLLVSKGRVFKADVFTSESRIYDQKNKNRL